MIVRPFDPERDRPACHRIWRECGWLKPGEEAQMDLWLEASRALVGDIDGEAECLVMASTGTVRHLESELSLSAITGVTTSYVARKRGMAARLLAQLVADEAVAGAAVSGLSMFEQGYYNQLGYGTTAYLNRIAFDPAALRPGVKSRVPVRLSKEDWQEIHDCRIARRRHHGACTLTQPELTRAEVTSYENGFGLGYRDDAGRLTHHVWLSPSDVESGPYSVGWLAYRDLNELMELFALLRTLGDQVLLIKMEEPAEIAVQDLISQPFKHIQMTDKGKYAGGVRARAPYQFRICDLRACIAATRLPYGEVRFNLVLTDPIEGFLPADAPWRGIAGEYRVVLGTESRAERGLDDDFSTLTASAGTFTRLWLGARTAASLAVTDGLEAPESLIRELDTLLRLPTPVPDWDF